MTTLTIVLIAVMNSLWQAALLAALVWMALRLLPRINSATRFAIWWAALVVAWMALRLLPRINSATRFAIWWAALVVALILPVAPLLISTAREAFQPATIQSSRPLYLPTPPPTQFSELAPLVVVPEHETRWPVFVAAVWGLAFLYRLADLLRSYLYLRGLKQRARVSGPPIPATGRTALVLLSSEIDSPVAVGFVHPAVVLPDSLAAELSREEMDHVLLHEAAHLARWDDWTNLAARILGAVLALHPVALWILRRIEIEREAACDDWVVSRTQSARHYARSLARLYELRFAQRQAARWEVLASGVVGNRSHLGARIEALLSRGRTFTSRASVAPLAASVAALIALCVAASFTPRWIAFAQSPRPAFDVASIKRNTSEASGIDFSDGKGGKLTVRNNPMSNVIHNAYGVSDYQLIGAPEWVDSERYDIEAKGTATASRKEIMLMLQTLLADRFAMKAHFETREMPAFILTVTRGGSKLHLLGTEDCVPFDPTRLSPTEEPDLCGNNHLARNNVWRANHISMPGVAGVLSAALRRPVIDRTGIRGTFDVSLQWTDELTPADRTDNAPPSIYTALRETLGLELKPDHGPVEVLVIDHIEKPTGN